MRLDEWQKYIGSQFLDDEPETVPAPKQTGQAITSFSPFLPLDEVEESKEPIPALVISIPPASLPVDTFASPVSATGEAAELSPDPIPNQAVITDPVPAPPPPITENTQETHLIGMHLQGARPETTPNSIQNVVTIKVPASQSPEDVTTPSRPPIIELLTPIPDQNPAQMDRDVLPEVTNRTRRRSQSLNSGAALDQESHSLPQPVTLQAEAMDSVRERHLFQPLEGLDADIPSFANYLPPSHSPASPSTASGTSSSIAVGLPAPIPVNTETVKRTSHKIPLADETIVEESEQDNLPSRRTSRSRSRHARNVRPENIPSRLSAAELWAAVPRHVQTLLSLERLEEEQEVAQFSYKRPFQETRHELIERLLDPILSLEDTARLLNVCPTTVRRYTNKGILTYYRKEPDRSTRNVGDISVAGDKETRQRRFRLSDILAFLETQQTALAADRQAESNAALFDSSSAENNGKEF